MRGVGLSLTKRWLRERRRDVYHRLAKEEGYRSRAAYKLLQTAKKYPLMGEGDVVVDLGAKPGGWMQAARRLVGEGGYVLGVDLEPMVPFHWPNVISIVGDVADPECLGLIRMRLPRRADVVLSDVSPNISGVWEVDHARQIHLAMASLRIAINILRPGGSFFVKVFQGDLFMGFVDEVKKHFDFVKIVKPEASRHKSSEVYILALDLTSVLGNLEISEGSLRNC